MEPPSSAGDLPISSEQHRSARHGSGNAGERPPCCEVIVTGPDVSWLADFTRALVRDRLAACGHLSERIRSIYRWQGDIHDEQDARLALHTRTSLVASIVDRARHEHPYEVPCVIALPILDGNPYYLAWILDNTIGEDPAQRSDQQPDAAGTRPGRGRDAALRVSWPAGERWT